MKSHVKDSYTIKVYIGVNILNSFNYSGGIKIEKMSSVRLRQLVGSLQEIS